ncbi:MAG: DnaJ domain-containing protein [Synechococcaceae cyanobacterium RL_1_2]|nr:DnaJ domain-containing protein [Synechococcaceae cyanobacterium RL_1_2]
MFFKIGEGLFKIDLTDHHAMLGIPLDADAKQVRKRYLKIAAKIHPDTCKFKDQEQANYAGQLLSKLINPAYEYLSKSTNLQEHNLILSQTGQKLAAQEPLELKFPEAKQLYQGGGSINNSYRQLVAEIAQEQFVDIDQTLNKIALLSELNLVYIVLNGGQERTKTFTVSSSTTTTTGPTTPTATPTTSNNNGGSSQYSNTFSGSKNRSRYSRAEELIKKENFAQAVIELRDRLKEDPLDPITHSLLGYAFLKQKQMGMAKIHTKKALEFDAKNTVAIKTLDAIMRSTDTAGLSKKDAKKGGFIWGYVWGKKK